MSVEPGMATTGDQETATAVRSKSPGAVDSAAIDPGGSWPVLQRAAGNRAVTAMATGAGLAGPGLMGPVLQRAEATLMTPAPPVMTPAAPIPAAPVPSAPASPGFGQGFRDMAAQAQEELTRTQRLAADAERAALRRRMSADVIRAQRTGRRAAQARQFINNAVEAKDVATAARQVRQAEQAVVGARTAVAATGVVAELGWGARLLLALRVAAGLLRGVAGLLIEPVLTGLASNPVPPAPGDDIPGDHIVERIGDPEVTEDLPEPDQSPAMEEPGASLWTPMREPGMSDLTPMSDPGERTRMRVSGPTDDSDGSPAGTAEPAKVVSKTATEIIPGVVRLLVLLDDGESVDILVKTVETVEDEQTVPGMEIGQLRTEADLERPIDVDGKPQVLVDWLVKELRSLRPEFARVNPDKVRIAPGVQPAETLRRALETLVDKPASVSVVPAQGSSAQPKVLTVEKIHFELMGEVNELTVILQDGAGNRDEVQVQTKIKAVGDEPVLEILQLKGSDTSAVIEIDGGQIGLVEWLVQKIRALRPEFALTHPDNVEIGEDVVHAEQLREALDAEGFESRWGSVAPAALSPAVPSSVGPDSIESSSAEPEPVPRSGPADDRAVLGATTSVTYVVDGNPAVSVAFEIRPEPEDKDPFKPFMIRAAAVLEPRVENDQTVAVLRITEYDVGMQPWLWVKAPTGWVRLGDHLLQALRDQDPDFGRADLARAEIDPGVTAPIALRNAMVGLVPTGSGGSPLASRPIVTDDREFPDTYYSPKAPSAVPPPSGSAPVETSTSDQGPSTRPEGLRPRAGSLAGTETLGPPARVPVEPGAIDPRAPTLPVPELAPTQVPEVPGGIPQPKGSTMPVAHHYSEPSPSGPSREPDFRLRPSADLAPDRPQAETRTVDDLRAGSGYTPDPRSTMMRPPPPDLELMSQENDSPAPPAVESVDPLMPVIPPAPVIHEVGEPNQSLEPLITPVGPAPTALAGAPLPLSPILLGQPTAPVIVESPIALTSSEANQSTEPPRSAAEPFNLAGMLDNASAEADLQDSLRPAKEGAPLNEDFDFGAVRGLPNVGGLAEGLAIDRDTAEVWEEGGFQCLAGIVLRMGEPAVIIEVTTPSYQDRVAVEYDAEARQLTVDNAALIDIHQQDEREVGGVPLIQRILELAYPLLGMLDAGTPLMEPDSADPDVMPSQPTLVTQLSDTATTAALAARKDAKVRGASEPEQLKVLHREVVRSPAVQSLLITLKASGWAADRVNVKLDKYAMSTINVTIYLKPAKP